MIKIRKNDLQKLPSVPGFFLLQDDKKTIYCDYSDDLNFFIHNLLNQCKDNKTLFEMFSSAQFILYKETSTLFEALCEFKKTVHEKNPKYNNLLRLNDDFVYLAIDLLHPFYYRICENTTENYLYIGPFQNRFTLFDYLDTLSAVGKIHQPSQKTDSSNQLIQNDKKMLADLYEIDLDLISELKKDFRKTQNNLQFEKAEILKNRINIINKFYEDLIFYHVTKKLNLRYCNGKTEMVIQNGILTKLKDDCHELSFPEEFVEYRPHEFLAHDKSEYKERKTVFRHFQKNNLARIDDIYEESVQKLKVIWENMIDEDIGC